MLYTSGNTFGVLSSEKGLGENVLLLTKPYRRADLARMVRLSLDRPLDQSAIRFRRRIRFRRMSSDFCGRIAFPKM